MERPTDAAQWRWLVKGLDGLAGMIRDAHDHGQPIPKEYLEAFRKHVRILNDVLEAQQRPPRSE